MHCAQAVLTYLLHEVPSKIIGGVKFYGKNIDEKRSRLGWRTLFVR